MLPVTAAEAQQTTLDIPSQQLASALERYGDLTGREVLYDASLASERRSASVSGSFTPEAGLAALLQGSGLVARFMADGSFVLIPTPEGRPEVNTASLAAQQRYYGRLQISLRSALCADSEARPGPYRLVALFWIGPTGHVSHYARLGSTGVSDRDRSVDRVLRHLSLGEPPPTGFDQPVLIMVVPQAMGVTLGCEADRAGGRAAGEEP